ncbi:MAG: glycosyltransferase family 39 protein [Anaerolineales bacterium]|jgi:4-amino-4-deoxy-L-arabinose transferase-like glycosyltransferase|nr:glycosyltransferase family 39 protein [Chloroflexota bacterium]MBK6644224.1 glycosyltransferase family 39 protein [Anaerolineales bacterium]MCC6986709.1 glycosyltransferase family 39 protein [Anaerolineales bacterium]
MNKTDTVSSFNIPSSLAQSKSKILSLFALTLILLLGAYLRFINLDSLGYVNHYYAAAVKSMLQSWNNFFFVAAEPGGSVSVDKPPVGLWLQAISAYFLGVNTLGLLLPQILSGLAAVVLVHHLVRRSFGAAAGLLAALALAVTPVAVAVERNNTIDSIMILFLLLAAWMFIKATETTKRRFLFLGALFIGIAFNVKMLAAYLPIPAFFALYFLGARENAWKRIGKIALTGVLALAVSFAWAIAVDLTPADQRPYVGSSSDNSELTLILGYNGVNRLLGMRRGGGATPIERAASDSAGDGSSPENLSIPSGRRPQSPADSERSQRSPNQDGGSQPGGSSRSGTPSDIGEKGALRLFIAPLSKETSWLLPIALTGILLLVSGRWTFPLSEKHQALALWGGWLLTGGVFFSVASYFHEYYLTLLAAPLAALVGIGIIELWRLGERRTYFAAVCFVVSAALTIAFQFYTASAFAESPAWLLPTVIVALVGAILTIASLKVRRLKLTGVVLLILSMFITPGIWSAYTALNPGRNLSLPAAYSGNGNSPSNNGNASVNQTLLDYLEENTQDVEYLVVVPSSMQGSDYVLASGRPVLYAGGFKGSDEVVTAEDLAQMAADGEIRYVYWGSQGSGNKSEISNWIASACAVVEGFDTVTRNSGAPDGTSTGAGSPSTSDARSGENQSITLYDCEVQ